MQRRWGCLPWNQFCLWFARLCSNFKEIVFFFISRVRIINRKRINGGYIWKVITQTVFNWESKFSFTNVFGTLFLAKVLTPIFLYYFLNNFFKNPTDNIFFQSLSSSQKIPKKHTVSFQMALYRPDAGSIARISGNIITN